MKLNVKFRKKWVFRICSEFWTKKKERNKKKRTLYHYLERPKEACRNNKIKSLTDFDDDYVSNVKSLATKKKQKLI